MDKQSLIKKLSYHTSTDEIEADWLDPEHPVCIIVSYPNKLTKWREYEEIGDKVKKLITEAEQEGKLLENQSIEVFHLPLKTKMPLGNPTTKLMDSAKALEALGVKRVYALIEDSFARLATKTISFVIKNQGGGVEIRVLKDLNEAAEIILRLQK